MGYNEYERTVRVHKELKLVHAHEPTSRRSPPPPPRSPFSSRKFHTSQPLFDISFSSRQYSLLSGRVSPVGLSEMGNTTGGTPDASMGDPTVAETVQGRVE